MSVIPHLWSGRQPSGAGDISMLRSRRCQLGLMQGNDLKQVRVG